MKTPLQLSSVRIYPDPIHTRTRPVVRRNLLLATQVDVRTQEAYPAPVFRIPVVNTHTRIHTVVTTAELFEPS
jgi:hypothetical protein